MDDSTDLPVPTDYRARLDRSEADRKAGRTVPLRDVLDELDRSIERTAARQHEAPAPRRAGAL